MTSQRETLELEQNDVALPDTGRPVIRANRGVISSGHYLTSMAGMRILLSGGNAFDALVAAGFAAAVVPQRPRCGARQGNRRVLQVPGS